MRASTIDSDCFNHKNTLHPWRNSERFKKGCVLGLLSSTCCWCIGYEARFSNSYWFQWVSDFIFHYIGAPGCGPIQANVRWIHYLWPPLFPLFFHRIKPRGGRRESLSIFHSTVATKILDSVKGCPEKKEKTILQVTNVKWILSDHEKLFSFFVTCQFPLIDLSISFSGTKNCDWCNVYESDNLL